MPAPVLLHTPEATLEWGRELAQTLAPGSIIALCGHLGAGKTQVTKGIVSGLGSTAAVTSPTFTLVHEYLDGRIPIFHFDLYRMDSPQQVLSVGWDDILDEPGIVIVEWADLFPDLLPPHTRWFQFTSLPTGVRQVMEGPLTAS
ncbi:tRNA threonylcarbamoyladenosine biosynthesis protein TsaE [Prosthecobacter fusiformis]|uniref:tRNA threonylcarbamoyladenosine biosynthesis protein TsaE n=1 Tax=Prosthecobacter fusiformis TaxID=48464 RepID=A0A4R7RK46_9BACT|nr:tRNA (adenosine(37)-N6)-threonylcarbamoyltransferase complex ATPase subunit type 1 TsaE [Prosthecobacter fusiformis]TDU62557.1 tRNA threonylcarbamoyladenosine biosynthesis protein TsaE [Prosthecobacter fusiformis]